MIQIGVYNSFYQEEGILVQKYRDRNGRCIAILFKAIGVRGRCDSPELRPERPQPEMAKVLRKPAFAILGCQQISVNTLLCHTLGLVESL